MSRTAVLRIVRVLPVALIAFVLSNAQGIAEVCDKVAPSWDPADGPVTILQELISGALFSTLLLGFLLALLVFTRRKQGLRLGILILLMLFFSFLFYATTYDYLNPHQIHLSAVREGCISGAPTGMVFAGIALFMTCGFIAATFTKLTTTRKQKANT